MSFPFSAFPCVCVEGKIGSGWNIYHGKQALLEATHLTTCTTGMQGGNLSGFLCLVHAIFESQIAEDPFPLTHTPENETSMFYLHSYSATYTNHLCVPLQPVIF